MLYFNFGLKVNIFCNKSKNLQVLYQSKCQGQSLNNFDVEEIEEIELQITKLST